MAGANTRQIFYEWINCENELNIYSTNTRNSLSYFLSNIWFENVLGIFHNFVFRFHLSNWQHNGYRPKDTFIPSARLTAMMAFHLLVPVKFEHTSGKVENNYAPENMSNVIMFWELYMLCVTMNKTISLLVSEVDMSECPAFADIPLGCQVEIIKWQ